METGPKKNQKKGAAGMGGRARFPVAQHVVGGPQDVLCLGVVVDRKMEKCCVPILFGLVKYGVISVRREGSLFLV